MSRADSANIIANLRALSHMIHDSASIYSERIFGRRAGELSPVAPSVAAVATNNSLRFVSNFSRQIGAELRFGSHRWLND